MVVAFYHPLDRAYAGSQFAGAGLHISYINLAKVDEWVDCMAMHYVATGRRLHNKTQEEINALAHKAWLEMSGAHGAATGHGHPGFQPAGDMPSVSTEAVTRQEIIETPDGRPMVIANSKSRILHRAESGGANDWEMVTVPGGRPFIRSPTEGHQEWLDIVVSGEPGAWPSPPPESWEHAAARLAKEELAAEASAMAAAAEATKAKALADEAQELSVQAMNARYQQMEVELAQFRAQAQAADQMKRAIAKKAADYAKEALEKQAIKDNMKAQAKDDEMKLAMAANEALDEQAIKEQMEAQAKNKAWDDKMKLALAKEAADDAKEALDKQAIKEHMEAQAKNKAEDDKMKLALAKQAADDAKEALDKQAIQERMEAQAMDQQAAKEQEAAERQELAAKEPADLAAKEQADMAIKDQKGVNLLGLMAQQVKRSA